MTLQTFLQPATTRISAFHERLPDAWRASFFPYLALVLPLCFASAGLDRPYITPFFLLTLAALYYLAKINETALFTVPLLRSHWVYMMPYFLFLPIWALLTIRPAQQSTTFLTVVIPTGLCLLLLIAPVQRFNRSRTVRRLPLRYTYPVVAGLALLIHTLHA